MSRTTPLNYQILGEYVIIQKKSIPKRLRPLNKTHSASPKQIVGEIGRNTHDKIENFKNLHIGGAQLSIDSSRSSMSHGLSNQQQTGLRLMNSKTWKPLPLATPNLKQITNLVPIKLGHSIGVIESLSESTSSPKWHLHAGFYASETSYTNIAFEIGLKPIHLLSSIGTNYEIPNWRLGLGSILNDNSKSQCQLNATIGFLKQNVSFSRRPSRKSDTINGQLYTVTLSWNNKLTSKYMVKIGPTFNILRTSYLVSGVATSVYNFPFGSKWYEDELSLLSPPFIIQNSFSVEKSSYKKKWIGLSIGLFYNFQ
ncbi:hypothetical protein [Dyadobacter aurulentus]|uniref:hypothetical protein n=1 Tax=Dyadobacter sp. UC 10 TaxID=2605428 RepID=UPI0011F2462D|nr:hypothetical protein [Dyadobacter sp. UC 10]KAA0990718.1 hypothetical protein FXO21_11445 [Dyadobacter sp. UC 10]